MPRFDFGGTGKYTPYDHMPPKMIHDTWETIFTHPMKCASRYVLVLMVRKVRLKKTPPREREPSTVDFGGSESTFPYDRMPPKIALPRRLTAPFIPPTMGMTHGKKNFSREIYTLHYFTLCTRTYSTEGPVRKGSQLESISGDR